MKKYFLIAGIIIASAVTVDLSAQHDHHPAPQKRDTVQEKKDTMPRRDTGHKGHDMKEMPFMSHAYSLHLPMNRNGSGTSWLPDETPMYMNMTGKKATWMFHYNIFLRYTNTDIFKSGTRGADKLSVPNWFMVMMNKRVGKRGLFSAKGMFSLDAVTEGGNGYPLLFQSGETFKGRRLVDRQHPHDLVSELSVGYTHAFNKNTDAFIYIAYPGEPALSAPAFMHRISALNIPDAPLGHHWQDATHITFGVTTLGVRYKDFKAEGSVFTGREPDEKRYAFDDPKFDSYSWRLSYNPVKTLALQVSQAYINEPELLEPGTDVTRTTASVLFSKAKGRDKHYDAALIWGYNDKGADHKEHSVLLENNYRFRKNAVYGRYEMVQKSTEELDLEDELGHATYDVHALTAGFNRGIWRTKGQELALGTQVTLNVPAGKLKPIYGDLPLGFQVYLQLRPVLHRH